MLTFFWLLFLGGEVPRLVAVEGEVGELGALGRLGLCLYATWVQEASSVGSVSMGWLGVVPDVDINEELDLAA